MLIKDAAYPGDINFLFIEERPFCLIFRKIAVTLWEYGLAEAVGGIGLIITLINEQVDIRGTIGSSLVVGLSQ